MKIKSKFATAFQHHLNALQQLFKTFTHWRDREREKNIMRTVFVACLFVGLFFVLFKRFSKLSTNFYAIVDKTIKSKRIGRPFGCMWTTKSVIVFTFWIHELTLRKRSLLALLHERNQLICFSRFLFFCCCFFSYFLLLLTPQHLFSFSFVSLLLAILYYF